eukprot:CAMPEP_0172309764 /NCGR_PEP_ID=MMETSP1058-20130122/10603_1 /TAXON_ID=83371 /ORGANISM="Detonula confervacea, Strain CCMP 353" /LENGTH=128 /DNA_ID=CAMNT_0013022445 /DNA_START=91 /DNA_END=477 /DNA_ORIENTATION=+
MKTTTATVLALAALFAPSPVIGREALLDDDKSNGTRRLSKSPDYYKSIYYRCCNTDPVSGSKSKNNADWRITNIPDDLNIGANEVCKCPVRGSESKTWFGFGSETYYAKWQTSCEPMGSLYEKAEIGQ